jgi:hypothetical protein
MEMRWGEGILSIGVSTTSGTVVQTSDSTVVACGTFHVGIAGGWEATTLRVSAPDVVGARSDGDSTTGVGGSSIG